MIGFRSGLGRTLRPLVLVVSILGAACAAADDSAATEAPPTAASASIPEVSAHRFRLGLVVHFDAPEHTSGFWPIVGLGAFDAAESDDVELTFHGDSDSAVQARIVDTLVADGVDGLIVSLADPQAMGPAIDRAAAAGIPVITINSGIEHYLETGALTHVGQYDSAAGGMVGERLIAMGVGGDVLCVIQEMNNIALEERCDGVEEAYRGGAVVRVRQDWELSNWAQMISVISDELEAGEFAAVVTLDLAVAAAAQEAIGVVRADALLTAFDVVPEALDAIRSGELAFTIDQQPYLQGSIPVELLVAYLRDGTVPDRAHPVETGPRLVDATNVDDVAAESARIAADVAARFGA